jgi:hypothetical protein
MIFGSSTFGEVAYGEAEHVSVRLPADAPTIVLKALLDFGGRTDDGRLVAAVAAPWFDIVKILETDPASIHQISWDKLEEIVAGAYKMT